MNRWVLKPESEKFLHLDVMRFVAAAAVVLFHAAGFTPLQTQKIAQDYYLFVDFFFVISGIVMSEFYSQGIRSAGAYGGFMRRRIARILPLHWATLAAYVVLDTLALRANPGMRIENYDPSCLPANILLLHAWGVCHRLSFDIASWSLSGEIVMYAFLPLTLLLGRRAFWAALVCGLLLTVLITKPPWWHLTYDYGGLRAIPAFLLGIGLHQNRDRVARIPVPGKLLAGGLILFAALSAVPGPVRYLNPLAAYALAVVAYAADLRATAHPWLRRLAPLGQLTFGVYLLHPLVFMIMMRIVAPRFHLGPGALNAWSVMTIVLVIPLAAYGSLVLFERPARHWINSVGRKAPGGIVEASAG
jgi:peptidoglycan/LPS O-acetylase OafA/YrhL